MFLVTGVFRAVKGNIVALFEDAVKVADNLNAVGNSEAGLYGSYARTFISNAGAALCNAASDVAAADQTDSLAV